MAFCDDVKRLKHKVIVPTPTLNLKKAGLKIRSHVNLNTADGFTFKYYSNKFRPRQLAFLWIDMANWLWHLSLRKPHPSLQSRTFGKSQRKHFILCLLPSMQSCFAFLNVPVYLLEDRCNTYRYAPLIWSFIVSNHPRISKSVNTANRFWDFPLS